MLKEGQLNKRKRGSGHQLVTVCNKDRDLQRSTVISVCNSVLGGLDLLTHSKNIV